MWLVLHITFQFLPIEILVKTHKETSLIESPLFMSGLIFLSDFPHFHLSECYDYEQTSLSLVNRGLFFFFF